MKTKTQIIISSFHEFWGTDCSESDARRYAQHLSDDIARKYRSVDVLVGRDVTHPVLADDDCDPAILDWIDAHWFRAIR